MAITDAARSLFTTRTEVFGDSSYGELKVGELVLAGLRLHLEPREVE